MQKRVGWLWIVGIFGFSAAAIAQAPSSSTAGTKFDGTYAFVSSTKVNETYMTTGTAHIKRCRDLLPRSPLTIVDGHARYDLQEGTVGSQGELATRYLPTLGNKDWLPSEIITRGRIDGNGSPRTPYR